MVPQARDRPFRFTVALVSQERSELPQVTVVVPVRNNVAGLQALLARLDEQTYPRSRFQVVVGDDGSEPGSLDHVPTPDHHVRVVRGAPQTSYAARNRAVLASSTELLAFCDSDCLPANTWLEEGIAALRHADLAAGAVIFDPTPTNVWSLLTADLFLDQEQNVKLSRAVTASLFATRRIFDAAAGFDESLPSGGDYDFVSRCLRLDARLVYADRSVVVHPTLPTAKFLLQKIWRTNRWSGVRTTRDRGRVNLSSAVFFIPLVGLAVARRRALRPIARLDHRRIASSGMRAGRSQELAAVALLYFLVAPVAAAGRVRGLLEGWRPSVARARYLDDMSGQRAT